MTLWNFIHGTIGMHVYEFLAILFLIAMLIIAVIHVSKEKLTSKNKKNAGTNVPAADEFRKGE